MKSIILFFAIALFPFMSVGQTKENKTELPADLLIRFSSDCRNRPPCGSYAITLNHDGSWVYEGFRGYYLGRFTAPELKRAHAERLKKLGSSGGKMPVERLSETDLVEIVKEFDAIDFFNLNASYSFGQTDPKTAVPLPCVVHAEQQTLYIRANGREKSVENFTGCMSETSIKLTALGEAIRSKLNFR